MGRRSDHSREELEELIVSTGHALMAEVGFAKFAAREVAKRIGYSVGTIYNVFANLDHLVLAVNTRTFGLWADYLRDRLAGEPEDRIRALVEGYFAFAEENTNLWMAIYDHRLPPGMAMPDADAAARAVLTDIVVAEVARALGGPVDARAGDLSRSLVATVHGHADYQLTGAFALMEVDDAMELALARVRESLAAGAR